MFQTSVVSNHGEHVTPADRTIIFYRNDGHPERIPLTDGTLAEAVIAIQRVFDISDGLYTKAEIFRGNELVETLENAARIHVGTILVQ
jgi:hypothetical protein